MIPGEFLRRVEDEALGFATEVPPSVFDFLSLLGYPFGTVLRLLTSCCFFLPLSSLFTSFPVVSLSLAFSYLSVSLFSLSCSLLSLSSFLSLFLSVSPPPNTLTLAPPQHLLRLLRSWLQPPNRQARRRRRGWELLREVRGERYGEGRQAWHRGLRSL